MTAALTKVNVFTIDILSLEITHWLHSSQDVYLLVWHSCCVAGKMISLTIHEIIRQIFVAPTCSIGRPNYNSCKKWLNGAEKHRHNHQIKHFSLEKLVFSVAVTINRLRFTGVN